MAQLEVRAEDGYNLPPLGLEEGTSYGWFDRWQVGQTQDGKNLTDYADWEARDLFEMLGKDYKSKQIENVLTLPIISAERSITAAKGDKGEKEWAENFWDTDPFAGGSRTSLDQTISLMTSAFYYKRAYFEKVWVKGTGQFDGKFVYGDLGWRPQTTCRIMRDPKNGNFSGFQQEPFALSPSITPNLFPIEIPAIRAFVFTHGTRRDPLNGSSDMEVAYWAWKTKQKVLLLWFQFLQSVSLPRIIVKANDQGISNSVAQQIARMKASGVLPLSVPGSPADVDISALDLSGKGHEQFQQVINWLDNAATDSVLAGFLNLTGAANMTHFGGSYALSKDASDFFLQSLEAKAREMEEQVRRLLFAPMIRANFGPDAAVPHLKFEPLNDIDKETAVALLKQAMSAPPGSPVPTSFIAGLAEQVSTYLGLDGGQMGADFKASFDAAAAQAQAAARQQSPALASPPGQAVAGLAGAVNHAQEAMKMAAHQDHEKATADFLKAKTGGGSNVGTQRTAPVASPRSRRG